MPERIVYLNGLFVPESEAKISIYDLSVMQAAGAFEMTRSFNGIQFKLTDHLERLRESCNLLGIPCPWPLDELIWLCDEVVAKNKPAFAEDDEHRLLIVVSPGCAPMYRRLGGVIDGPHLTIADFPLRYTVAGMGRLYRTGVKLETVLHRQIDDATIPSRAKHRSRLHFHLAADQAKRLGGDDAWAIMESALGEIAECPGANIVVMDQSCRFRAPSRHALRGISQAYVMDLLRADGNYTTYTAVTYEDLLNAKEIWITGTPFSMLPVRTVDGKRVGNGTHPVFDDFLGRWSQSVYVDIARQVQQWDEQPVPC